MANLGQILAGSVDVTVVAAEAVVAVINPGTPEPQ